MNYDITRIYEYNVGFLIIFLLSFPSVVCTCSSRCFFSQYPKNYLINLLMFAILGSGYHRCGASTASWSIPSTPRIPRKCPCFGCSASLCWLLYNISGFVDPFFRGSPGWAFSHQLPLSTNRRRLNSIPPLQQHWPLLLLMMPVILFLASLRSPTIVIASSWCDMANRRSTMPISLLGGAMWPWPNAE